MHKLSDIARLLGLDLDPANDREIARVTNLEEATPNDLSYITAERFVDRFAKSNAGVILAQAKLELPSTSAIVLRVPDPELAIGKVLTLMSPPVAKPAGIHPTAVIAPDAVVGEGVAIGANVSIAAGVKIGAGSVLHPNVVVGQDCSIGEHSELYPNVVLRERVAVGSRVIIHAGSVIGTDGFGYRWDGKGHAKIPQIGTVVIEDDVEIGSCTCIDRAKFGETRIGRGTKIDNLVQVGHNVKTGMHCILCGQVGIAGSTVLGNGVVMGGNSAAKDHVKIADGTMVAARGGVGADTSPGEVLAGYVGVPMKQFLRENAAMRKLPDLIKRLRELEEEVAKLKPGAGE